MCKTLSVTGICGQRGFPGPDDGRGEAVKRREAEPRFRLAHQQLGEPVEPTAAHLDHPASHAFPGLAALGMGSPAAVAALRDVALPLAEAQPIGATMTGIGVKMLASTSGMHRPTDRDGVGGSTRARNSSINARDLTRFVAICWLRRRPSCGSKARHTVCG
jgi:hypothetical protein